MKKIIIISAAVVFVLLFVVTGYYVFGYNRCSTIISMSNKGHLDWDNYTENNVISKEDNKKLTIVENQDDNVMVVNWTIMTVKKIEPKRLKLKCNMKFVLKDNYTGKRLSIVENQVRIVNMEFKNFEWVILRWKLSIKKQFTFLFRYISVKITAVHYTRQ